MRERLHRLAGASASGWSGGWAVGRKCPPAGLHGCKSFRAGAGGRLGSDCIAGRLPRTLQALHGPRRPCRTAPRPSTPSQHAQPPSHPASQPPSHQLRHCLRLTRFPHLSNTHTTRLRQSPRRRLESRPKPSYSGPIAPPNLYSTRRWGPYASGWAASLNSRPMSCIVLSLFISQSSRSPPAPPCTHRARSSMPRPGVGL